MAGSVKTIHLIQCPAHGKDSVSVGHEAKRRPPLSVGSTSKSLEK